MFGNLLKIFTPVIKVIWPLFRIFINPRFLFPLIAIWYNAPRPWRIIKDFFVQNVHITAIIYGILTAVALLISLSQHDSVVFAYVLTLSMLFLLSFPLLLLLFNRVHYKNSKRINWRETFQPAKDLVIVWFCTTVLCFLIILFILRISKK